MILTLPVLDLTWMNAAEFAIPVSITVVLRQGQWCSGAFGPFQCDHTNVSVTPSFSPFILLQVTGLFELSIFLNPRFPAAD